MSIFAFDQPPWGSIAGSLACMPQIAACLQHDFSPSKSPGSSETVTHLRGQTKPDANRPKHLHEDYVRLTAGEVFPGYSWNPKVSQACSWLSRGNLLLPKQNIFLFKPQTPVDYVYAIFHLPSPLLFIPLSAGFESSWAHGCWVQGGTAGGGVQKGCLDRALPKPPRIWAAPLFKPAWLCGLIRTGQVAPVLLQEGEFAMLCLFGISSIVVLGALLFCTCPSPPTLLVPFILKC